LDQVAVLARVRGPQIVEQLAPLADQLEQPPPGMEVLDVGLEVLGEAVDALGEERYLNLRRPGVVPRSLKGFDYLRFLRDLQCHAVFLPPECAAQAARVVWSVSSERVILANGAAVHKDFHGGSAACDAAGEAVSRTGRNAEPLALPRPITVPPCEKTAHRPSGAVPAAVPAPAMGTAWPFRKRSSAAGSRRTRGKSSRSASSGTIRARRCASLISRSAGSVQASSTGKAPERVRRRAARCATVPSAEARSST